MTASARRTEKLLVAAGLALGAVILHVLLLHRSEQPQVLGRYSVKYLTGLVLYAGLMAAGLILFLSNRARHRVAALLGGAVRCASPPAVARRTWAVYPAVVVLAAAYLVRGLACVADSTHMGAMDTGSYLRQALYVKEHGGALASPLTRIEGDYHEANQHPLYPSLLSLVAEREPAFFVRAKLLTLGSV